MRDEGRPIRGREVKHFFTRARTPTSPVDARYMHKSGYNKLNNLFPKDLRKQEHVERALKECPISCNGRPLSGSVIFVSFQSADLTDAAVTER